MSLDPRVAALREAFDRSFAAPAAAGHGALERLIEIRAGGDPYVVRLAEIGGLDVDRRVTLLPGGAAAQVGLAGIRGRIVPVYDLAALLGYPRAASPRWLATLAATRLAVAFDAFDGYLQRDAGEIAFDGPPPGTSRHVVAVARAPGFVRPVISLASVVRAIEPRRLDTGGKGA